VNRKINRTNQAAKLPSHRDAEDSAKAPQSEACAGGLVELRRQAVLSSNDGHRRREGVPNVDREALYKDD
jgi:hypothetical protein